MPSKVYIKIQNRLVEALDASVMRLFLNDVDEFTCFIGNVYTLQGVWNKVKRAGKDWDVTTIPAPENQYELYPVNKNNPKALGLFTQVIIDNMSERTKDIIASAKIKLKPKTREEKHIEAF